MPVLSHGNRFHPVKNPARARPAIPDRADIRKGRMGVTLAILALTLAVLSGACSGMRSSGRADTSSAFETARSHIQAWLSKADTGKLFMTPSELQETIVNDWERQEDRYQIVSVRRPEDFDAAGHIPHAVNCYWSTIVTDDALARLDPHKSLVLYCYYGHASMLSCTILNLMGYNCRSLSFGMMGWNLDALAKEPWDCSADYEVESAENEPGETFPQPDIESAGGDAASIIRERARAYLASGTSPVISSADVKAIIDDWNRSLREVQIVDVRSKSDYGKGHVPHAIHIPWARIADSRNLRRLDPGKKIVVCSGNGQTGQLAATALVLLGYNAFAMRFGMMDWNSRFVDASELWTGAAGNPVVRTTASSGTTSGGGPGNR